MAESLWRTIAGDLHWKIETEELGTAGDPLPNEQELTDSYRASRNTVREALRWLGTRGEVVSKSGQGTYIKPRSAGFEVELSRGPYTLISDNDDFMTYVKSRARDPSLSEVKVDILPTGEAAVPVIGRRLVDLIGELKETGDVISRRQIRKVDGQAHSLQRTFYPTRFADDGAADLRAARNIEGGGVAYISEKLGIDEVACYDRLAVRVPDPDEADDLGLPDDGRVQVIEIVRVGYSGDGSPVRVTATTYRADISTFGMRFGDVPA
jgi:GntR family transcriptional regulator